MKLIVLATFAIAIAQCKNGEQQENQLKDAREFPPLLARETEHGAVVRELDVRNRNRKCNLNFPKRSKRCLSNDLVAAQGSSVLQSRRQAIVKKSCESCLETPMCKKLGKCEFCEKICAPVRPDDETPNGSPEGRSGPPREDPEDFEAPIVGIRREPSRENVDVARETPPAEKSTQSAGDDDAAGLSESEDRLYTLGAYSDGPLRRLLAKILRVQSPRMDSIVLMGKMRSKHSKPEVVKPFVIDTAHVFTTSGNPDKELNLELHPVDGNGLDVELTEEVNRELDLAIERKKAISGKSQLTSEEVDRIIARVVSLNSNETRKQDDSSPNPMVGAETPRGSNKEEEIDETLTGTNEARPKTDEEQPPKTKENQPKRTHSEKKENPQLESDDTVGCSDEEVYREAEEDSDRKSKQNFERKSNENADRKFQPVSQKKPEEFLGSPEESRRNPEERQSNAEEHRRTPDESHRISEKSRGKLEGDPEGFHENSEEPQRIVEEFPEHSHGNPREKPEGVKVLDVQQETKELVSASHRIPKPEASRDDDVVEQQEEEASEEVTTPRILSSEEFKRILEETFNAKPKMEAPDVFPEDYQRDEPTKKSLIAALKESWRNLSVEERAKIADWKPERDGALVGGGRDFGRVAKVFQRLDASGREQVKRILTADVSDGEGQTGGNLKRTENVREEEKVGDEARKADAPDKIKSILDEIFDSDDPDDVKMKNNLEEVIRRELDKSETRGNAAEPKTKEDLNPKDTLSSEEFKKLVDEYFAEGNEVTEPKRNEDERVGEDSLKLLDKVVQDVKSLPDYLADGTKSALDELKGVKKDVVGAAHEEGDEVGCSSEEFGARSAEETRNFHDDVVMQRGNFDVDSAASRGKTEGATVSSGRAEGLEREAAETKKDDAADKDEEVGCSKEDSEETVYFRPAPQYPKYGDGKYKNADESTDRWRNSKEPISSDRNEDDDQEKDQDSLKAIEELLGENLKVGSANTRVEEDDRGGQEVRSKPVQELVEPRRGTEEFRREETADVMAGDPSEVVEETKTPSEMNEEAIDPNETVGVPMADSRASEDNFVPQWTRESESQLRKGEVSPPPAMESGQGVRNEPTMDDSFRKIPLQAKMDWQYDPNKSEPYQHHSNALINGIQLPLNTRLGKDGKLTLSVDIQKLCGCENGSCKKILNEKTRREVDAVNRELKDPRIVEELKTLVEMEGENFGENAKTLREDLGRNVDGLRRGVERNVGGLRQGVMQNVDSLRQGVEGFNQNLRDVNHWARENAYGVGQNWANFGDWSNVVGQSLDGLIPRGMSSSQQGGSRNFEEENANINSNQEETEDPDNSKIPEMSRPERETLRKFKRELGNRLKAEKVQNRKEEPKNSRLEENFFNFDRNNLKQKMLENREEKDSKRARRTQEERNSIRDTGRNLFDVDGELGRDFEDQKRKFSRNLRRHPRFVVDVAEGDRENSIKKEKSGDVDDDDVGYNFKSVNYYLGSKGNDEEENNIFQEITSVKESPEPPPYTNIEDYSAGRYQLIEERVNALKTFLKFLKRLADKMF